MTDTAPIDLAAFRQGLDALYDSHVGPQRAEQYLREHLDRARQQHDDAAALTVLGELMGLQRTIGQNEGAMRSAEELLALAHRMDLPARDPVAYGTTLINAATALRAAGDLPQARTLYTEALAVNESALAPGDRRLAALHNNLSLLASDSGDPATARSELQRALEILETASVDPATDTEIATTHTNLTHACLSLGDLGAAQRHAEDALAIYRRGESTSDPHYAAALAASAQVSLRQGRTPDAVAAYSAALPILSECFGVDSEPYRITADNRAVARERARAAGEGDASTPPRDASTPPRDASTPPGDASTPPRDASTPPGDASTPPGDASTPPTGGERPSEGAGAPRGGEAMKGLDLARAFWEQCGRPMVSERYPEYAGRIAVGLVGHGSECYGFDDAASRDHDFGPSFCMWLTPEDHAAIGERLSRDYEALPATFLGVSRSSATPRASGEQHRRGVFEIGAFFSEMTGYASPPTAPHEWLLLPEATLAAATNGAVFHDPSGAFSRVRNGFLRMPTDVRLAHISRRLGMASQTGQYNVPRMLGRTQGGGQAEGAWLEIAEFVRTVASLVFLLNKPTAVGYLPYEKWMVAALLRLAGRMGTHLGGVVEPLMEIMRLSSAACFGGAGTAEGEPGGGPARERLEGAIARICTQIVAELHRQDLSTVDATFLEWHRPQLAARIRDPWLRAQ